MRKVSVLVVLILVFGVAAPAMAAPSPPTDARLVGDRIDTVTGTPATYPSGAAFHIFHAWFYDFSTIDEARDQLTDPDLFVEVDIDGVAVALRTRFNVWDVDATCSVLWHERILERVHRARLFLRLADRWDCAAEGMWVKGYYRNYRAGMAGIHDFEVSFFDLGVPTAVFGHTVDFTP